MSFSPQDIEILKREKANGRTKEQALATLVSSRQVTPTETEASGMFSGTQGRLADVGQSTAGTIGANLAGTGEFAGQSPLRRGVQATAAGFSAVPRGALAMAPEPVRTGVDYLSEKVGAGFKKLTGAIGGTELFKGAAGRQEVDPVTGAVKYVPNDLGLLEEGLGIAASGGEIAGTIAGAQGAVGAVNRTAMLGSKTLQRAGRAMEEIKPVSFSVSVPRVGELVTKYRTQLSDIDPQYETILKQQPDATKTMAYFDQAEKAALDPRAPMATTLASKQAVNAFEKIDRGASEVGKMKSELLDSIANEKIPGNIAGNSIDNVKKTISERYGIKIDNKGNISQVPGRMASVDAKSQALISEYVGLLRELGPSPTARQLDDFVDAVQRKLYKQSSPNLFEVADEPVIAFLKQQTGEINSKLKTNVDAALKNAGKDPIYGELNTKYGELLEINNSLSKRLGVEGDKGASLMKSLFSPQTGEPTRRLFQQIKDETGIDLFEEATLAKFAMESVGDTRSKSLLQEIDAIAGDVSKVNLMEPGSWLNFIREKADLDGRELAEAIIKQATSEIQK
jgi:hypothetical protein